MITRSIPTKRVGAVPGLQLDFHLEEGSGSLWIQWRRPIQVEKLVQNCVFFSICMFWSSVNIEKWMLLWICIKFDWIVTKNYFPPPASHHPAHRVLLERSSYHWAMLLAIRIFPNKNFWLIKDYFQIESAGFARSFSWWSGNARALQWWLWTSALGGKGLKRSWENY